MSKKSTRESDVPAKVIKDGINVYSKELATLTLTLTLNSCLEKELFPGELKIADASPIFKKNEDLNKENYEPVNILFHMPKV